MGVQRAKYLFYRRGNVNELNISYTFSCLLSKYYRLLKAGSMAIEEQGIAVTLPLCKPCEFHTDTYEAQLQMYINNKTEVLSRLLSEKKKDTPEMNQSKSFGHDD
ncbi:hypothetical protein SK128_021635 [Halocaridina rubra]|uniref:Uncharacterized protein n=1 Tax=Halocaridina rubra TaxID=373956 RepID=A0AAN9A1C1_HALRR